MAFKDTTYYNENTCAFKYVKKGSDVESGYLSLKEELEKAPNKQEFA